MTIPPIPFVYEGQGVFRAANYRALTACGEHYGQGEVATLAPVEERSRKSHDHFFAAMGDLWESRPEHLEQAYPTADSFRRRALIAKGFCDTDTTVCTTKAEALRLRAMANRLAPDSLATIEGVVVTIYTAHSQSMRAMGKARFQASKDACLDWAYAQLGIDSGQGGAGANNPRAEAA